MESGISCNRNMSSIVLVSKGIGYFEGSDKNQKYLMDMYAGKIATSVFICFKKYGNIIRDGMVKICFLCY